MHACIHTQVTEMPCCLVRQMPSCLVACVPVSAPTHTHTHTHTHTPSSPPPSSPPPSSSFLLLPPPAGRLQAWRAKRLANKYPMYSELIVTDFAVSCEWHS